jgi:hypothetical protein
VVLFVPQSGKTKGHVSDLKFPRWPGAQHRVWDNATTGERRYANALPAYYPALSQGNAQKAALKRHGL